MTRLCLGNEPSTKVLIKPLMANEAHIFSTREFTLWDALDIGIRSILEDSPVLLRFSLLASCVLLFMQKFRDSLCMQSTKVPKQNKQQRSCILVQTRTQHKKRVPIVAEEMSQVLFSIVTGIK